MPILKAKKGKSLKNRKHVTAARRAASSGVAKRAVDPAAEPKLTAPKIGAGSASVVAGITGSYVYDKASQSLIKISSEIPNVSARSGSGPDDAAAGPCGRLSAPGAAAGGCGRSECGQGSCAMPSGEDF